MKKIPIALLLIAVLFIGGCVGGDTTGQSVAKEYVCPDGSTVSDPSFCKAEETATTEETTTVETTTVKTTSTVEKTKSAELSIVRVQIQLANLYPTRVKVENTGDFTIYPEFDLYVYDEDDNEVCSGSPLFGFGAVSPGKSKIDEISILGCMFTEDGDYELKIDLLDSDYNKLDTDTETFTVDYWGQFGL